MQGNPEFSGFMKSSVVYAAMHVCRIWNNGFDLVSLRFDKLTKLWKAFRHFLTANRKKTFQRISGYNFGCEKKALSDFLASSSSWNVANTGRLAYDINLRVYICAVLTWLRIFRDTVISILVFVNENCCVCKCFTEFYFIYWVLVVSLAIFLKIALLVVFSRTWTSLVGVVKLPRVSNALRLHSITHNKTIKWRIYIVNSLLCCSNKQQLALQVWRMAKVRTKLLPCIPHRFYYPAYLLVKKFYNVVNSVVFFFFFANSERFDLPDYWMSTICLAKLWKTSFCPRYVSLLKNVAP